MAAAPTPPYSGEPSSAVMRLRSDPHMDAALSVTGWQMASRLPATLVEAIRLGWRVDRPAVLMLLVSQVLSAALVAGSLAATSTVLTRLVNADGPVVARLEAGLPVLVILVIAMAGYKIVETAGRAATARLAPRVTREADLDVLQAATAVELEAYESPGYEDALQAGERGAEETRELPPQSERLLAGLARIAAAASIASVLHPVLLPLLLLAAAPRGVAAVQAARIEHAATHRMLSDTRLRSVLRSYTIDRRHAAEVRAGTMSHFLLDRYRAVAARLEREDLTASMHALRTRLTGDAVSALALVATWVALLALLATGRVDLAVAGTAVVAIRTSSGALTELVRASAELFRTSLFVDDWRRYLDLAVRLRLDRGSAYPPEAGPEVIAAERVAYTYPGTVAPALGEVDLTLRRGEIVALVGENGSGKTTLANILTGLLLPTDGHVRWDDADLAASDAAAVWRRVGMVPQDYTRWPMTVRENITLGQPRDDGCVRRAAEAADATPVIGRLPHGLDTLLARSWWGGHELSSGQWQRIAIARAFHRDAPVVILDEPTSALDPRAEHQILTRMRTLAHGRIALFITHRLVNVKVADRILVLDQGRVVEDGTFEELLDSGGLFAELYKLQQDQ